MESEKNTGAAAPLFDENDLFRHRRSVTLTPENAAFAQSAGRLVSLTLKNEDGTSETFERVILNRSFPISSPDSFICVREPDTKEKGQGDEIGIIENVHVFDDDTVRLFEKEFSVRYFTPEIFHILNSKEKFGYTYWDAETSAGRVEIVINDLFNSIREQEDGRITVFDMDGDNFVIPDPKKLDRASYRVIETFL